MATSSTQYNNQIYCSRKNLLDILYTNGYDTAKYNTFSEYEINTMIAQNQLDMMVENPQKKRKIYIHYFIQNATIKILKPAHVNTLIENLYDLQEELSPQDILYIITFDNQNVGMISHLKQIWYDTKRLVIVQNIVNLQFNVLTHKLQPKCRVLSETEKQEIKRKYYLTTDSQFPEISRFDPLAKALFIRPEEVCEFIRDSETAIVGYYYRICVNDGGIYKAIASDHGGED